MFINWLLNVFPAQMFRGWRLVRRDLALWVALFTLLAVASVAVPQGEQSEGPGLAMFVMAATAPDRNFSATQGR